MTNFHSVALYIHILRKNVYLLLNERFVLESKDPDGVDSTFFPFTRQFFGISSFIPTLEDILKLYIICLKLLNER